MISDREIRRIIEEEEEGMTLDYKEELTIATVSGKAGFVKDLISLANSGEQAHIIIGVEDGTRKLVGMENSFKVERLNQILTDKIDPPLRIEYKEIIIMGYRVGIIEIAGNNPPYVVAVHDKYGGIERGTIFVRNFNMNEGARRADIDRIYEKIKPLVLESDIHLSCETSVKPVEKVGELIEVTIDFKFHNYGDAIATDTYVWTELTNIEKIIKCNGNWHDISKANEGRHVVSQHETHPIIKDIWMGASNIVVKVKKETKNINARIRMGASNMRTRSGICQIAIVEGSREVVF